MRTVLFVAAVVAAVALLVEAVDVDCNITLIDKKNKHAYNFDMTQLHHNDSVYVDSFWYRTPENNIYYINFCGQVASACDQPDTSVCLRVPKGDDFDYLSAGKTSTQEVSLSEDGSPQNSCVVTYSQGAACKSGTYTTHIVVSCQVDADPGFMYDINETDECAPTLFMYSSSGCGVDVPYSSDAGEIFALVLLLIIIFGLILYFAIGAFYQWKFNGAQSASDFVIHKDFWFSLPFLVKDGVMFIFHGCKSGDYVSV